jgi:hypothetical protein
LCAMTFRTGTSDKHNAVMEIGNFRAITYESV